MCPKYIEGYVTLQGCSNPDVPKNLCFLLAALALQAGGAVRLVKQAGEKMQCPLQPTTRGPFKLILKYTFRVYLKKMGRNYI